MTKDEAQAEAVRRYLEMADDALETARREANVGPAAAVNRAYYACFYAASAVLLFEGYRYTKHAALRSGLHKHLVRTGRIPKTIAEKYKKAMDARHDADYSAIIRCTPEDAARSVEDAEAVVAALKHLLPPMI